MLTRVAMGQVRFTLPGLAPDARGIAIGRELVMRFGSLDRVVSFLRALSGERLPDELWAQLRLEYARLPRGPRELVARAPVPSTPIADAVARAARLAGGQCFTGAGRHHVPYRDAAAPLGYDVDAISHEAGDLFVYTDDALLSFTHEGQIPFEQLLLRLDLRRVRAGRGHAAGEGGPCFILARRGLGPVLLQYLHRAGVVGGGALRGPK
jgi:hypothetical protein